jgi:hypothetical protein
MADFGAWVFAVQQASEDLVLLLHLKGNVEAASLSRIAQHIYLMFAIVFWFIAVVSLLVSTISDNLKSGCYCTVNIGDSVTDEPGAKGGWCFYSVVSSIIALHTER